MMTTTEDKTVRNAIAFVFVLFLLIRILGAFFLDNNWSFTHLFYIPIWYYIIPILVPVSFYLFTKKETNFSTHILENRLQIYFLFGFFFLIFFIFQSDSILYGGGNYKVKQIAQVDTTVYRFYEYGSTLFVSLLFKLFSLFDLKQTTAGVFAWKLYAYIGIALTFIASILLSKTISEKTNNRFLIFLIIFLGPQTISYFGIIGNATLITTSVYFFIYFGLQYGKNKSAKTLAILWTIAIFSVFMHLSLLILIPSLLFITSSSFIKRKNVPFILGIKTFLLLTLFVFWETSTNFAFSKYFLFLEGGNLRADYNLFSLNHILDFIQLLLLFVPQIIIVKLICFKDKKNIFSQYRFQLLVLLILSSNVYLFISEPTHAMLLDAPIFAVYFCPIAVLLSMLLAKHSNSLKLVAVFSLFVPLLVLPSYIKINLAEKQIETHIEKNHYFYIEGAAALKDSYQYMEDLDKANHWYLILPKESRDFLDLSVADEFNYASMYSEALRMYIKLKTKFPFWGKPRFHIASIMMKQKRFDMARAEIDTVLMLEPYEKEYIKLDYGYYRDKNDFNIALKKVLYATTLFPSDYNIKTDLAIMYYRVKDIEKADSTARDVISNAPTQAYAYLIRGFVAQVKKQPTNAIKFFKEYIRLAPDEPETPDIRKLLNNLILQERGN